MVEEEKPAEAEEHLKALRRIFRPKKPEGSKPAEKKAGQQRTSSRST